MSATYPNLDLDEQIARIRRAQVETDKFAAETRKLLAEGRKFDRERSIQTLLAFTGLIGGIVTVVQLLLHLRGGG